MRISRLNNKLVVITAGDPSGIGPEIILKALAKLSNDKGFTPLVIGDRRVFQKTAKILRLAVLPNLNFIDLRNVKMKTFRFGVISPAYGKAAMEYIAAAVAIAMNIRNTAVVTAPINKGSINRAGFKWSGHTEFLAKATKSKNVTMMFVSEPLKVSLATRHVALKDVATSLTREKIIATVTQTYQALKEYFRLRNPRIGVAGLNPHAGEGGVLGSEEKRLIIPALGSLRKKIKNLAGPIPADVLFYKAYRGELDAVVCMYHDQGLAPLKMVAFEKGVNLTIGLPFMRTSPDHGTAFEIAGRGKASPSSMIEAIKLAATL